MASGSGRNTHLRRVFSESWLCRQVGRDAIHRKDRFQAFGPEHWRRFRLVHQSVCGHVTSKWVGTHLFCYKSRVAGKWVRIHLFCYESYVIDKYLRIECRRQVGLDIELLLGALRFFDAYLIMHFG